MKSVSVIIPTWNREKTLKRAIESALNQTLSPIEILVCDDGSTDNTYKIVESLNNAKVKWFAGKHTGLPAVPRNRGIKNARGEWLAFLDSDDEWLPNKLEKQLRAVKQMKCRAACANAYRVKSGPIPKKSCLDYTGRIIEFSDLLKNNYVISSSALIHKSLIPKCLGFPEALELRAVEDYAFWLRILTQTDFAYVNENLVYYTDEPKLSIRKTARSVHLQRKAVFQNFLSWSSKNRLPFRFILLGFIYYLLSEKDFRIRDLLEL